MRLHFDDLATAAGRDAGLAAHLAGLHAGPPARGPRAGGRSVALAELTGYDAGTYGKSRNFTAGTVSRLSPYLRHGMVAMPEVRDAIRDRYPGQSPAAEEFLKQLAWRDFFDKVLDWHGAALQADLEPAKHGVARRGPLPADIAAGATGLPCMDAILADLFQAGYLHNHERLWFAAYLCHWRGIDWKEGAKLFREYLYDGDSASNSASWQWVESTFSNKPYFMNQENIAHYTANKWCADCRVKCPFRASYETLQHALFAGGDAPLANQKGAPGVNAGRVPLVAPDRPPEPPPAGGRADTVVWVHDAAMSAADVTVKTFPDAPVVFVFDEPLLRAEPWAFHRLAFVLDGVADLAAAVPGRTVQIRLGDPAEEVAAFAAEVGAETVALTDGPYPGVRETAARLTAAHEVRSLPRPVLAEYADEPVRFTRYWNKVAGQVLGYTPKGGRKQR